MRLTFTLIMLFFSVPAWSTTVLVVGDSISAAYGLAERDGWVHLAGERLAETNDEVTVINASISGDTTSGGLARLPDALERFEPDVVIIELGGNDGLRGYSLKEMRQNLIAMVTASEDAGASVLLLGMQIPTNYGAAYTRRFAQIFQKVADATGAAIVPFFLEPIALERDYFQRDGVHPTADAQPLLLEHVMPELSALLEARDKVKFTGGIEAALAGLVELPDGEPIAYALFAHCFTCGKDIVAASRISRELVKRGIGVMRFDFTGIGHSEGDFATTNFSSNVKDMVKAADFLREHYAAPSIMIGHSLGGTATLRAALQVPECKGVVTIGSPADAQHVAHQFQCDIETIEREGEATVSLAGRPFTIQKQFLDDIRDTSVEEIHQLKPALLVMHSPTDATVDLREAERIYTSATHPKSFISLDGADHLLSQAKDSEYVAEVIASWSTRFLPHPEDHAPKVPAGELFATENDHKFKIDLFSDTHHWQADEPIRVGGKNSGPDPYEHLLAAVGSCTAMTVRMYANRKEWPLDDVKIKLRHSRQHQTDCEDCDEKPRQLDVIDRELEFVGDLTDEQRARLLEIADKCPVHRTLTGTLAINSREIKSAA